MKLHVKESLHQVETRIHYSFDLWTGPNRHAYLGPVGHWIDAQHQLRTGLLGLQRFQGAHTGENQAASFWKVICDFEVQHLIGKFTMDNASNNDTTLVYIAKYLKEIGITNFDPIGSRVRCFGHILNLCVKAFLWGEDINAFERNILLSEPGTIPDEISELPNWRKRGPLGKLHNILLFITRTPQRIVCFEDKVRLHNPHETVFIPKLGNVTHWSSDYKSLECAFRLREPIEDFVTQSIR